MRIYEVYVASVEQDAAYDYVSRAFTVRAYNDLHAIKQAIAETDAEIIEIAHWDLKISARSKLRMNGAGPTMPHFS